MNPTQADKIMALADAYADAYGAWTSTRIERRDALRAALAEQPAEQETVAWDDAQRICDLPAVDDAIRALLEDQTNDNAVCVVQAILAEAPHPAIPPGYKLVPVEPTEEMCNPSGEKGPVADMSAGYRKEIWKSMLAAAPNAPQPAIPPGYTLVNSGTLQMVVNALRRDAAEGKTVRGEMAYFLTAGYNAKNDITGETK